jgi:hypothetical protein
MIRELSKNQESIKKIENTANILKNLELKT